MAETSTGLKENTAGVLCYVLGWVTGIVFLIIEPKNKFVRFHALQSIITFAAVNVASEKARKDAFAKWKDVFKDRWQAI